MAWLDTSTETRWAILSDFDHTVTTQDVTDTLLEQYALPQWRDIEALWEQGEIGSLECMQKQIALLRASVAEVEALADGITIDPYFKAFATMCRNHDIPLVIASDGLDFVIKRILAREGLTHIRIIASHLAHTHDDRWELTGPFSNADCTSQASTCKCAMSRQVRSIANADKLLYIGDGRSDFCVSLHEADLILAKDSLLGYCQDNQLPHQPFASFAQASQLLQFLIVRPGSVPPATIHEEPLHA